MQVKERKEIIDITPEDDREIFLTITVGNAQVGGSTVKFVDSPSIGKGDITNLSLGKGEELHGKVLNVVTNVLDVNEQTNGVVVTWFFSSCQPPAVMLADRVDNNGDVFSFDINFRFA